MGQISTEAVISAMGFPAVSACGGPNVNDAKSAKKKLILANNTCCLVLTGGL